LSSRGANCYTFSYIQIGVEYFPPMFTHFSYSSISIAA